MNDKKKGFTLIELLMVITLMGGIGAMITISLAYSLNNTKQKNCDEFVKEVEDAACVYAGLSNKEITCERNNCDPIKLEYLIDAGLILSETDSCTNNDIDINQTVSVSWSVAGEKKCEYNGVKEYEK